jgi:hypothetical protein
MSKFAHQRVTGVQTPEKRRSGKRRRCRPRGRTAGFSGNALTLPASTICLPAIECFSHEDQDAKEELRPTLADCLPICLPIQVEKGGKMRKIYIRNLYLVDSIESEQSWQSGGRGFDPRQLHQFIPKTLRVSLPPSQDDCTRYLYTVWSRLLLSLCLRGHRNPCRRGRA